MKDLKCPNCKSSADVQLKLLKSSKSYYCGICSKIWSILDDKNKNWEKELLPLIEWAMTASLPKVSFKISSSEVIIRADKYLSSIKKIIDNGTGSNEHKSGLLKERLSMLYNKFHNQQNNDNTENRLSYRIGKPLDVRI